MTQLPATHLPRAEYIDLPRGQAGHIEIVSGFGYAVNSNGATEYIAPGILLIGVYTWHAIESSLRRAREAARNRMGHGVRFNPETVELQDIMALRQMVEGVVSFPREQVNQIYRLKGHFGRWSLPGYLDCSEWEYDTFKERLIRHLKKATS